MSTILKIAALASAPAVVFAGLVGNTMGAFVALVVGIVSFALSKKF